MKILVILLLICSVAYAEDVRLLANGYEFITVMTKSSLQKLTLDLAEASVAVHAIDTIKETTTYYYGL